MDNEYYRSRFGEPEPTEKPQEDSWSPMRAAPEKPQEDSWQTTRTPSAATPVTVRPVTITPAQSVSVYRPSRPAAGDEYRDAGYIPRAEAPMTPRYPVQEPRYQSRPQAPKPREKKSRGHSLASLICACLVCALLGGTAGGIVTGSYLNNQSDASNPPAISASLQTPGGNDNDPAQTPITRPVVSYTGENLSGEEIYQLSISRVVGVTTELTTTNRFGQSTVTAVSGSGFIIREDGYIITNYHVIETAYTGGYQSYVFLENGDKYPATIINVAPDNDIAVLKIDAKGLSAVSIGDSDAINVGEKAYVIGNPLGELTFSMTDGIVSALDREISTETENKTINMFQITAAVNRGNSGGPVFNSRGEVIGVVTAKYSDTGVEGLGFAIPINDAAGIADTIIAKGGAAAKPAYLGVLNPKTMDEASALYFNNITGVLAEGIQSGSAAETAGMKAGDIITKLGGTQITSAAGLVAALRNYRAGDTAIIVVYRDGRYLELSVVFDEVAASNN